MVTGGSSGVSRFFCSASSKRRGCRSRNSQSRNSQAARACDRQPDRNSDGVKLHYLMAGHGPAVVLLHGYAETSRMWRPLMRTLASRFTVIAPDLPGIGDSDIPSDGLDMSHAARADACARRRPGCDKGSGGGARHWIDGRVCVCGPVPCRC